MSNNISFPPIYTPITSEKLNDLWFNWFSETIQTLVTYLTAGGILVPQVTTAQRDALVGTINGQMIYNTTTNTFQGFKAGAWVNF